VADAQPRRHQFGVLRGIDVVTGLDVVHRALHDFVQNQIWCAIVALALELTAWTQTLALTGHEARRWEPKRLRPRLFSIPARAARTGRRRLLHLPATAPFTGLALAALEALTRLTATPRVASG